MPATVELGADSFLLTIGGAAPVSAAYRDVTTLAVDQGRVLLVLGGEMRILLEQLGSGLGTVVGVVRDRRARQLLADRFIELPPNGDIDLVEYASGEEHGVGQLAYHAWGAALLPLEERNPARFVRRADMTAAESDGAGGVRLRWAGGAVRAADEIDLLGLGDASTYHAGRLDGLRQAALGDAATIVGRLLPDAPFGLRRAAAAMLVDGRPVSRAELADGWPWLERAVLSEPVFAASYAALAERSGRVNGSSWISLSPRRPGEPDHQAWFFVALPSNLVALELVSEGAHATYLFRVVPRGEYRGQKPDQLGEPLAEAVSDVSEALVDVRFLRQPLFLTEERLAEPRYLRQRLAIAALPSVQRARARFVGRLIHRDEQSWAQALDDVLAWHAAASDDNERWPGAGTAMADEDELDDEGGD